jgi:hypothetical protein
VGPGVLVRVQNFALVPGSLGEVVDPQA